MIVNTNSVNLCQNIGTKKVKNSLVFYFLIERVIF